MTSNTFKAPIPPIRSTWREDHFLMRGPLTDRKIEKYRKAGYYSPQFREARREAQARKESKRHRREGNFLINADGNFIFSPQ